MKLLLNPKYEFLKDFIDHIDEHFEKGREIYRGRNRIRVCEAGGLALNVKRYCVPLPPNRLIYSFFRRPKGERAFLYPSEIIRRGFESPEPVAYIERRRHGLIAETYFISLQSPYRRNFYEFGNARIEDAGVIVEAFADFAARLHGAGILHKDFSPGNILFDFCDDRRWHFSLVDTNRMQFGPVSVERGCKEFARLWGQPWFFRVIADRYAAVRGADPDECYRMIMAARRKFWKRYARKREIEYDYKEG